MEKPEDDGPTICIICGKKIPMCQICGKKIMEEKEVYTIEPCGHSVHKGEIYNKSWKKETEKNMT